MAKVGGAGTMYTVSVRRYRSEANSRVADSARAWAGLRDKTTAYAKEIAALRALHEQVQQVWTGAEVD